MSSLLLRNLRTILTCDDGDAVLEHADLYCENGIIRGLGPDLPQTADTVIDGSHYWCYPGLINTHHHLYQVFSRNLPQVQNLELFDWLTALYEIWKGLDEQVVRLSSLTGMGELLKHGCTTCFDHHYVFPAGCGDLIGTQFAAAEELGMRMFASRGSMDLSRKDGGLPPDSVVQTVDAIMKDSARVIEAYHDPSFGSMRQVALAPCSPFSVSGELLRQSAILARQYGVRLHTHLCETRDEEHYTLEHYGVRPLEYMASLGWTGPDVWYAHGIHFNDEELRELARTGTGVAHCPISNMKLASGVARVPEMLALDVPVGLAVDGSASNDGSSLMEELRVCYLLHRLTSSEKAPSGYQVLKMATRGSARLLGREDIGQLAVGKCADFFLVDSRRLELVGGAYSPADVLATVGLRGGERPGRGEGGASRHHRRGKNRRRRPEGLRGVSGKGVKRAAASVDAAAFALYYQFREPGLCSRQPNTQPQRSVVNVSGNESTDKLTQGSFFRFGQIGKPDDDSILQTGQIVQCCPQYHRQLSRCLQRWGLNIVFVAINTSFGDADAFPKLLLREVFIFPQFPEPKPEIEYLSTSHIHAPHGLYYMG